MQSNSNKGLRAHARRQSEKHERGGGRYVVGDVKPKHRNPAAVGRTLSDAVVSPQLLIRPPVSAPRGGASSETNDADQRRSVSTTSTAVEVTSVERVLGMTEYLYTRFDVEKKMAVSNRVIETPVEVPRTVGVLRFALDDTCFEEVLDVHVDPPCEGAGTSDSLADSAQAEQGIMVPAQAADAAVDGINSGEAVHDVALTEATEADALFADLDSPFAGRREVTARDEYYPLALIRVRTFSADAADVRNFFNGVVMKAHADHRSYWVACRQRNEHTFRRFPFPLPSVTVLTSVAFAAGISAEFSLALRNASSAVIDHLVALQGSALVVSNNHHCSVVAVDAASDPVWVGESTSDTPSKLLSGGTRDGAADPLAITEDIDAIEADGVAEPQLPLLHSVAFSMMIRSPPGSVVGTTVTQLETIRSSGFINYTSSLRHGLPTARSLTVAKKLLAGECASALVDYAMYLAQCDGAVYGELDALGRRVAGYTALRGMDTLARRNISRDVRDTKLVLGDFLHNVQRRTAQSTRHRADSGVSFEHMRALNQLLQTVVDTEGDVDRVLSEVVPERALRDHVRTASDVCFNVIASHRIRKGGMRVLPGDIVCSLPGLRWDISEPPLFGIPTSAATDLNSDELEVFELTAPDAQASLHVVRDAQDAKRFTPFDIVLPKLGVLTPTNDTAHDDVPLERRIAEAYPWLEESQRASAVITSDVIARATTRLGVSALVTHNLAPPPTFRRLFAKPEGLEVCAWHDHLAVEYGDRKESRRGGGRVMAIDTFVDKERVRHLVPFGAAGDLSGLRHAVRVAVQGADARAALLRTTRNGVDFALRGRLAAGVSLTSMLREAFQVADASVRDVLRLAQAQGLRDIANRAQRVAVDERNSRRAHARAAIGE